MIRGTGIDSTVKLYLKGNGANGSTKFFDDSQSHKTVTVYGNAQISTTQSKFGGSSIYFDSSENYLDIPGPSLVSSDFYIGFWYYNIQSVKNSVIFKLGTTEIFTLNIGYGSGSNNLVILVSLDGTSHTIFKSMGTATNNTQVYFAVSRVGTTYKCYRNGVLISSSVNSGNMPEPTTISYRVGGSYGGIGKSINGYMDDLQLIVGAPVASIDLTKVPTRQRG